jgi:hypothetical protein
MDKKITTKTTPIALTGTAYFIISYLLYQCAIVAYFSTMVSDSEMKRNDI